MIIFLPYTRSEEWEETGPLKVRIALHTGTADERRSAAALIDDFEDGVFLVVLAPIIDSELVASTVAGALSVSESAGRALKEDLRDFLSTKELLLVPDNIEQVVESDSSQNVPVPQRP